MRRHASAGLFCLTKQDCCAPRIMIDAIRASAKSVRLLRTTEAAVLRVEDIKGA
jgi:hypothetical protein